MKAYYSVSEMRLVGKAWEIKAFLKQIRQPNTTLEQYLHPSTRASRRPANSIRLQSAVNPRHLTVVKILGPQRPAFEKIPDLVSPLGPSS